MKHYKTTIYLNVKYSVYTHKMLKKGYLNEEKMKI
ncbi:hypothetical protein RCH18_000340 [Flavobacterium sp. PL11]|nr:hypothetical protein [Flavobacterium sp. PL11]